MSSTKRKIAKEDTIHLDPRDKFAKIAKVGGELWVKDEDNKDVLLNHELFVSYDGTYEFWPKDVYAKQYCISELRGYGKPNPIPYYKPHLVPLPISIQKQIEQHLTDRHVKNFELNAWRGLNCYDEFGVRYNVDHQHGEIRVSNWSNNSEEDRLEGKNNIYKEKRYAMKCRHVRQIPTRQHK